MAMATHCDTYNPLRPNIVERTISAEVWVCTAEKPVTLYQGQALDSSAVRMLHHGEALAAEKDGDWLAVKGAGAGLYAPFFDEWGNRNFKNQRTLAMEEAVGGKADAHELRKPASDRSLNRSISGRSTQYASEGSDPGAHPANKGSFRWVDGHGTCHRFENDADLSSELWINVSHHSVPYRSAKDPAAIAFDKSVPVGGKVNVIKEDDDWLRVMEISDNFDATELLGRRSLRLTRHLTVKETEFFLPVSQGGVRLFMPEQMALFAASATEPHHDAHDAPHGSCSLM